MEEEGKLSSNDTKFNKYISNQDVCQSISNTQIDSMINSKELCNQNSTKIYNYLQALRFIKGSSNEKNGHKHVLFTENSNVCNVSEFSQTNVNSSKEENVNKYIRNPIEKNIFLKDNDIKKMREFFNNYISSINIPYRMNEIFKPILGNILEIEEEDYNEEDSRGLDKKDLSEGIANSKSKIQDFTSKTTVNKCSTAHTGCDSLLLSSNNCQEIHPFDTGGRHLMQMKVNNKSEVIQDLDEAMDVNIGEYYRKTTKERKKMENDTIDTIQTFHTGVQMNILDLNLFDISEANQIILPAEITYVNTHSVSEKKNNSKILIVDSVLNLSQESSGMLNINARKEGLIKKNTLKKNSKKKNRKRQKLNNRIDDERNYGNYNMIDELYFNEDDSTLINPKDNTRSKSISLNDGFSMNCFSNSKCSEKSNRVHTKYFKSEIFDRHYLRNISDNKIMSGNKALPDLIEDGTNNISMVKEEDFMKENLLEKFQTCKNSPISHVGNQFEVEMINLIPDNENDGNSGLLQEVKIIDEGYKTPKQKIRRRNKITDLTFPRLNFSPCISLSRSEKNISIFSGANENSFIQTVYDLDFISNLLAREAHYKSNPEFINNHKDLMWGFRATLIDWLMGICEEFAFKRDTFHYTVNYVDRFLSRSENVKKKSLQLLGIASLGIAAKLEEVQIPKAKEYLIATDNSYNEEEFCATEKQILRVLKWEIIPVTINTWMNWYLCQWDLFVDTVEGIKEKISHHIDLLKDGAKSNEASSFYDILYFKMPDDKAYFHYRQIAQLIDLYTVDHNSLKYSARYLVAASMLMVLCSNYGINQFRKENVNKFDFDAIFVNNFIQSEIWIVKIFGDFLRQSFDFSITDPHFCETFVYCAQFQNFAFMYELPLIMQQNNEGELGSANYEDVISYQTHNDTNIEYLQALYKVA